MIYRSLLFVPGNRGDRFARAFACGADAVVIDLEDAVPSAQKDEARRAVAEWLQSDSTDSNSGTARLVRINAPGSDWIDDDCDWLHRLGNLVDGVVLPKIEIAEAIEGVQHALPELPVVPLLETARGILGAAEILGARAEMPAVLFGAEDLTAELGIPRTLGGEELLYARSRVVLAAAATGIDPIDAVWVNITDTAGLRQDAGRAKALGFRGKMAIHPDQVSIINEVFSPTADEIAAARRIVEADERAQEAGEGAFRLDDRMVDAPVIKRARQVLELSERLQNGARGL